MMVLFFTHIPFVVNHTINATPPERLQQSHTARPTKDQNGVLHINEEDILGRWRVHFQKFSKLVTITPLNTKMHLREENTITAAEVFLAVKTLKAVRAAGWHEIRPEVLKGLEFGVLWLLHVPSVLAFWKESNDWDQTWVILSIHKKGDRGACTDYRGISLLSLPVKVNPKYFQKRCFKIIEPDLGHPMRIPNAGFVLAVALQTKFSFSSIFSGNLWVCQRRLHQFCQPREISFTLTPLHRRCLFDFDMGVCCHQSSS